MKDDALGRFLSQWERYLNGEISYDEVRGMSMFSAHPNPTIHKRWWNSLTNEQRHELAGSVCHGCGSFDTRCLCWNDE